MPQRVILATIFASVFVLSAELIGHLAGMPRVGPLSKKIDHFKTYRDSYDLLFFGSSRVYHGIIPARFDAELAQRGHTLRSFNFAIAGMEPHETNALLRRILAMHPKRLRFVVIELGEWDPVIHRENRFKKRAILWHDDRETLSAWRSTWLLDEPLHSKIDLSITHAMHFAARSFALGRGPDAFRKLANLKPSINKEETTLLAWRGFAPFSASAYDEPSTHPGRRYFKRYVERYRLAVERLGAANRASSLAGYNVEALRNQIAMVEARTVEPLHLLPPTVQPAPYLARLRNAVPGLTIWAFNDPQAYPELYRVESRFDFEHLSQEAAERFSTLLAMAMAEHLEATSAVIQADADRDAKAWTGS